MRNFLVSVIILFVGLTATAQIYTGVSTRIGYPFLEDHLSTDFSVSSSGFEVWQRNNGSFGGGVAASVTLGYRIPVGFLFEGEFEYFKGCVITSQFTDSTPQPFSIHHNRKYYASFFNITPTVGIQVVHGKFGFFTKSGVMFGLRPNTTMELTRIYENPFPPGQTIYEESENYFGGIAFGFKQKMGLSYFITKNFSASIEFDAIFQWWSPEEGERTQYDYNGVDQLAGLTYSATHFIFVTEPAMVVQQDQPSERSTVKYSLCSLGGGFTLLYHIDFHGRRERQLSEPK